MTATQDRQIARHVAIGDSLDQIAEAAGCTRQHVERRLLDPVVQTAIRVERDRASVMLSGRLVAWAHTCGAFLVGVVADPDAPLSSRVRAAQAILSEVRGWRDADILERMTTVERRLRDGE